MCLVLTRFILSAGCVGLHSCQQRQCDIENHLRGMHVLAKDLELHPEPLSILFQVQPEVAELHSHLIPQLAILARNMVRDLDPQVHNFFLLLCVDCSRTTANEQSSVSRCMSAQASHFTHMSHDAE